MPALEGSDEEPDTSAADPEVRALTHGWVKTGSPKGCRVRAAKECAPTVGFGRSLPGAGNPQPLTRCEGGLLTSGLEGGLIKGKQRD